MLHYLPIGLILFTGMLFSVKARKLTFAGALLGGLIGALIFLAADYIGIAMMSAFFILGVLATSWKQRMKENIGAAEENKGRRTAAQVMANAGVAGLLSVLILIFPKQHGIYEIMVAASFSSATADTLSSELGTVYGSNFYNILTFKKDKRGLDGVISLEGSLIGIGGSIIIATIYVLGFVWNVAFLWIVIAGTIGNLCDSILGTTLERKEVIGNNWVNFLNTFIAALAAWLLHYIA